MEKVPGPPKRKMPVSSRSAASPAKIGGSQWKKQPVNLGKLEALKFKMQLQNKNLKLLVEHNDLMSNINKSDSVSRRDSKFHTNQSIKRLERDLEKSSKQLQQEINNIRS